MDFTSSRNSNSPTRRAVERPPFRLCFSRDQLPGRASIHVSKVNGDPITPKFYSKEHEDHLNANDTLERVASQEKKNSGDAHRRPQLTSRAYGWWHEQGIAPIDSRLNFRKKTSDLVNVQLKIYAENRKLKG